MAKKLGEIELRTEEVQEILSKVPNWMIRWGSALFLLLIFLILCLSWFIKYPDIIKSDVTVTTLVPPQKEFAMVDAKIDSIYVIDSQKVYENSILAVFESSAVANHVFFLKSILDTIQIQNEYLDFPIDEIPILFLGEIDQSFAQFENSYLNYELNRKLQPFANQAVANKLFLSEQKRRLVSLSSQLAISESQLSIQKRDLERNSVLFEKGVISEKELENKQLEVLSAESDVKNLRVTISQLREVTAGATLNYKDDEINRTREEIQLFKMAVQSFNQLKMAVKDWENKYVLKSKINGKVSFFNYWNENQTVKMGDLVFTIIPSFTTEYIAKLNAPLQNSGKIQPGQNVNIKLFNYPETEFGMLKGKVRSVSLTPDEEGKYLIDVSLPAKLVTSYNKEIEFKQEMRGEAEIITNDLRLLERLFYQFKELIQR